MDIVRNHIISAPTEVAAWTPLDMTGALDWFHASEQVTMGVAPNDTRVQEWAGMGSSGLVWISDTPATAMPYTASNPELGGLSSVQVYTGNRQRMSPGWVMPHPCSVIFLAKVGYTSNYAYIFRDTTGVGNGPRAFQRVPGNQAQVWADPGININGTTDGLNYNTGAGALLTSSNMAQQNWHLIQFDYERHAIRFLRDGIVIGSGSRPDPLFYSKEFTGNGIWLGYSIDWQIADVIPIAGTVLASDFTQLKQWVLDTYGITL